MSTQQNSNIDTSTSNANWGTLVIVLLVVIVGVVVGWITLRHLRKIIDVFAARAAEGLAQQCHCLTPFSAASR